MWGRKRRDAAEAAGKVAEARMRVAESREPEVARLSEWARTEAEANHFIERLNMHVRRKEA